jgi:glycine cleavage system aminomethyltransferase T
MVRGVYANRYLAIYMGEDAVEKYWTLRQKALVFDVPEKPIEITGPDAVQFLEKILARKVSTMQEGRGYYAIACTPQGGPATDHLMTCGKPHGMEFSSTRALTIRRIEGGGILGNTTDIDITMTPYEAGLAPFINMGKGDFIGRDALVDRDTRSVLYGLTCETHTPAAGSVVLDDGREVGYITSGAPSPTLGLGIGYVRFETPGDWSGRAVSLRLLHRTEHESYIVGLPFFDREKKIARGIDRSIPERTS